MKVKMGTGGRISFLFYFQVLLSIASRLFFELLNVITYSSRETKGKNLEEYMRLIMSLQSELHGLAALQWSICQDSLSRYDQKLHIP